MSHIGRGGQVGGTRHPYPVLSHPPSHTFRPNSMFRNDLRRASVNRALTRWDAHLARHEGIGIDIAGQSTAMALKWHGNLSDVSVQYVDELASYSHSELRRMRA